MGLNRKNGFICYFVISNKEVIQFFTKKGTVLLQILRFSRKIQFSKLIITEL